MSETNCGQSVRCYKIFYTKNFKKKKKVYQQGILVLATSVSDNKKATSSANGKIYSSDGQLLLSFKEKKLEEPEMDEQYIINHTYLILIDQAADIQSFKTGKIFMNEALPIKPINKNKKIVPKNQAKQENQVQLTLGLFIEKHLHQKLREHQIQGIKFMFECLTGRKGPNITGCILADYMGLGKTLQMLALGHAMLKAKIIKKIVVVCPLTLLTVWQKQTKKWLQNKLFPLICYGDGSQTTKIVQNYANSDYRMLVISYETFYRNIQKLSGKCDLLVFDEGHRLKNKKSKLLLKMRVFKCQKRVLLTGTPIQNNLEELFTCISLINPLLFPNQATFKNVFSKPILQGMSKNATTAQKILAKQRTIQLSNQLKLFSLRRNTDILEKYLPKKTQYIIFFQLTQPQKNWYTQIISQAKSNSLVTKKNDEMFRTLSYLRKLFTHPWILKMSKINNGENQFELGSAQCNIEASYKMQFIMKILKYKLSNDNDDKLTKVVIVSYFTETLDFIAERLKESQIRYAKLDGRMKSADRKRSLNVFQNTEIPVLLLSGKAGGTGLTLICATTMILVDPDWNPSNDSQVMGRVWRQGQTKQVEIYRLIIACSFEQKMLQRQSIKKNLAATLIDNQQENTKDVDFENLGQLFIENKSHVLTFPKNQNDYQNFVESHPNLNIKEEQQNKSGIIFIKEKCSHNNNGQLIDNKQQIQNQFENPCLILKQCQTSQDEESSNESEQSSQIAKIGQIQQVSIKDIKNCEKKSKTVKQQTQKQPKEQIVNQSSNQINDVILVKSQQKETKNFETDLENSEDQNSQFLIKYRHNKKTVDQIRDKNIVLKKILKKK